LNYTQVSDLSPLEKLSRLTKLRLANTAVSSLPEWLLKFPELRELDLQGTPISHLPYEILNQGRNCYRDLKQWFDDLQDESPAYNEEVKVMVLGNGRVGKTCIVDRLTGAGYLKGRKSTHAIQMRSYPTTMEEEASFPLTLNFWDFGGQDIYHGTHRIFMQSRALFLLVWDWEGENNSTRPAEAAHADGYEFQNHVIPHWQDYIRSFSKSSPVILVQNKIDKDQVKTPPHEAMIENLHPVSGAVHVSAEKKKGFAGLRETIEEVLQGMPEWRLKMPAAWHRARTAVRTLAKAKTDISQEEFQALCEEAGVRKVSRPALLRYLHDSGVLYHQKKMFHGRIILNQQWIIEAIYALFERQPEEDKESKGLFWEILGKEGRFTFKQLHYTWRFSKSFSKAESRLGLSFMLSGEICYRLNKDEHGKEVEPMYIAPQLLPESLSEDKQTLWPTGGLFVQYRYSYLHQVFIQRFIVRAGHLADPEQVWRSGTMFVWQKTQAVIQAQKKEKNDPGGYIQMQVSGPRDRELLERVQGEFKEIHPGEITHEVFVSVEGSCWVKLDDLQEAHKEQTEQVLADNREWVAVADYAAFLEKREGELPGGVKELQADTLAPLTEEMKRGWKDTLTFDSDDIPVVLGEMTPYAENKARLLSSNYYRLKRQYDDGQLVREQYQVDLNTLVGRIFEVIDRM